MWLLSVNTATGAALAVPAMPPMLSSRTPPENTVLFATGSDESIIWFDSDSVFADGATFSLLPSPASMSAQSILKRVTLGHVARMFRCSCGKRRQYRHSCSLYANIVSLQQNHHYSKNFTNTKHRFHNISSNRPKSWPNGSAITEWIPPPKPKSLQFKSLNLEPGSQTHLQLRCPLANEIVFAQCT